ncbi:MAG: ABC transporter ATP-binding protein [Acidobacteria bacterium]|nr:ABC transporter ATP-binding protein [Acidobacteriota bacterium]
MNQPLIEIASLGVKLGNRQVLADLDFKINEREIVTIIGRSGSGKSTFLDVVMGLLPATQGTINRANPRLRMSYIFQRPALLPWRTVAANVALPLTVEGKDSKTRLEEAHKALHQVGLYYARNLFPFQLSGGMAQRVAIARALTQKPDLMLMDEPFSSLDPLLRENMNINLLRLWQRTHKTILFVTHSIDEAVILSDRILILEAGRFVYDLSIPLKRPRSEDMFHESEFAETVRTVREHLQFHPNLPQMTDER